MDGHGAAAGARGPGVVRGVFSAPAGAGGPLPLAPELKFVLVAALGVPACFAVGHAFTRLPGVNRVL